MLVRDILRRKGDTVTTLPPDATIRTLLDTLAEHNIGAVVVTDGSGAIRGIVSERDVVRELRGDGAAGAGTLLEAPVETIMTRDVATVSPDEAVDRLTVVMTERRVRHMPVVEDGRLVGIVSIGDVVKVRIDELEDERESLIGYIGQGG